MTANYGCQYVKEKHGVTGCWQLVQYQGNQSMSRKITEPFYLFSQSSRSAVGQRVVHVGTLLPQTTLLSLYLSCWSYVQFLPSQARNYSGGHTTVSNDAARNLSQFVAQPESDRVSSTTDICMILSDILINSCLFSYEQIFSDSKTVLQSYNSAARSQQKVKDIQLHYLHSLT